MPFGLKCKPLSSLTNELSYRFSLEPGDHSTLMPLYTAFLVQKGMINWNFFLVQCLQWLLDIVIVLIEIYNALGCALDCPFEEFVKLTKDNIPSADWHAECRGAMMPRAGNQTSQGSFFTKLWSLHYLMLTFSCDHIHLIKLLYLIC